MSTIHKRPQRHNVSGVLVVVPLYSVLCTQYSCSSLVVVTMNVVGNKKRQPLPLTLTLSPLPLSQSLLSSLQRSRVGQWTLLSSRSEQKQDNVCVEERHERVQGEACVYDGRVSGDRKGDCGQAGVAWGVGCHCGQDGDAAPQASGDDLHCCGRD